jgi:hypothetical protein
LFALHQLTPIWRPAIANVELLKYLDNGQLIAEPGWFPSVFPTVPASITAALIQPKIGQYRQPPHGTAFTRVGDWQNKPNIFRRFEAIPSLPAKLLFNGPTVV